MGRYNKIRIVLHIIVRSYKSYLSNRFLLVYKNCIWYVIKRLRLISASNANSTAASRRLLLKTNPIRKMLMTYCWTGMRVYIHTNTIRARPIHWGGQFTRPEAMYWLFFFTSLRLRLVYRHILRCFCLFKDKYHIFTIQTSGCDVMLDFKGSLILINWCSCVAKKITRGWYSYTTQV
jgi:hypothetical protein